MSEKIPSGEERKVELLGGAAIDGAPVAYVVVLAAVVTALAFVPFSFVLATGGSFPLSQGIYALVGFVLGPIAGAVASGIGCLLGVFLAPHTAGVPFSSILGAIIAAFAGGSMVISGKRRGWGLWLGLWGLVMFLYYAFRAIFINNVSLWAVILGDWSELAGILLFLLPTRIIFARWISDKNLGKVALGLFLGTWASWSVGFMTSVALEYTMFNWPQEVFYAYAPMVPIEYLTRCIIAVIIGTGVIAGLRAIGVVKPEHAIY